MACMRYLYFAKIAEDEGFADVALAFRSIAECARCGRFVLRKEIIRGCLHGATSILVNPFS